MKHILKFIYDYIILIILQVFGLIIITFSVFAILNFNRFNEELETINLFTVVEKEYVVTEEDMTIEAIEKQSENYQNRLSKITEEDRINRYNCILENTDNLLVSDYIELFIKDELAKQRTIEKANAREIEVYGVPYNYDDSYHMYPSGIAEAIQIGNSLQQQLGLIKLSQGQYIMNDGEVMINEFLYTEHGYEIGDVIPIGIMPRVGDPSIEKNLVVETDEYKVVGIFESKFDNRGEFILSNNNFIKLKDYTIGNDIIFRGDAEAVAEECKVLATDGTPTYIDVGDKGKQAYSFIDDHNRVYKIVLLISVVLIFATTYILSKLMNSNYKQINKVRVSIGYSKIRLFFVFLIEQLITLGISVGLYIFTIGNIKTLLNSSYISIIQYVNSDFGYLPMYSSFDIAKSYHVTLFEQLIDRLSNSNFTKEYYYSIAILLAITVINSILIKVGEKYE